MPGDFEKAVPILNKDETKRGSTGTLLSF